MPEARANKTKPVQIRQKLSNMATGALGVSGIQQMKCVALSFATYFNFP